MLGQPMDPGPWWIVPLVLFMIFFPMWLLGDKKGGSIGDKRVLSQTNGYETTYYIEEKGFFGWMHGGNMDLNTHLVSPNFKTKEDAEKSIAPVTREIVTN